MSATATFTVTVVSGNATAVNINSIPQLIAGTPGAAAGAALSAASVTPPAWASLGGSLVLGGANANLFTLTNSGALCIGPAPLAPGTYTGTITATP